MIAAAQKVLDDPSVLNATLFCIAATFGQVLHAVKKWADGFEWVFTNPRRTVGAVVANVGGMVGFISTGALSDIPQIGTVIALGIFMGLSADSVLNKGSQVIWDDARRAKEAAKKRAA